MNNKAEEQKKMEEQRKKTHHFDCLRDRVFRANEISCQTSWYSTSLANSPHVNSWMAADDFSGVYVDKIPGTTNNVLFI